MGEAGAMNEGGYRIDVLAQPKQRPFFVPDRRSVYWVDRQPLVPEPNGTTQFAVNKWQNNLAKHKTTHPMWEPIHRPTPIWPVSKAAQNAEASARLAELATHKSLHSDYQFERPVYTLVTPAAQSATTSERLNTLSQQKKHLMWPSHDTVRDGPFSDPITMVSEGAKFAIPTDRLSALAEHKSPHHMYQPRREVMWKVSEPALNAAATFRLQQLARPKSSRLKKDDYDPYKVSLGAKNASATPRVTELSEPIPRKCRQKKV